MILFTPLCYLPFTSFFETTEITESYVVIGRDTFFLNGNETFESFEFKLSKRGGESGAIKFSKILGDYKIGDNVRFYLKGKIAFQGVIEVLDNYGLDINIIPVWGLLDYAFITDSIILDDNEGRAVIEVIQSLKQKIMKQGINYNDKNVIIPPQYILTGSMAGKSLRAILDECEKQCPENYVWGVDSGNNFYFKQFSERANKTLSWHTGDFSDNEYVADFSNLVSSYVVKIKNNVSGFYNVLKYIVGDSDNYPPTIFTNIVGRKTKTFELNFTTDNEVAYNYVYDRLRKQSPAETLKLKILNIDTVKISPNEALKIFQKPIENIYEDIEITATAGRPSTPTQSNQQTYGEIVKVGLQIGYARKRQLIGSILDFTTQANYNDLCNRSFDIYRVEVFYNSPRSFEKFEVFDDEGHSFEIYGNGGFIRCDIKGFNKRSLKLRLINDKKIVFFYKMRCYFNQGSRVTEMNVRNITYKYSKGILNADCHLAKLNATLTGYIFEENLKIKNLEKLLTQN